MSIRSEPVQPKGAWSFSLIVVSAGAFILGLSALVHDQRTLSGFALVLAVCCAASLSVGSPDEPDRGR